MSFAHMQAFAGHWLGKLAIVAVISLFLWHGMHRVYHGLHDIGIHAGKGAMVACYGVALVATLLSIWLVLAIRL